ncbi:LuxR C-terminal-related transcriptional regulator [Leucobacter luti]|uniref:helix-turn-helix transcriptional regulator n=1 Tax=Leucobacter luti TaxID=340320 RepID=UPI003D0095DB
MQLTQTLTQTSTRPGPESPTQRLLQAAVVEFARATRFPLAFGGFEADGVSTVTALEGNRTLSLAGLRVVTDRGLGGRAVSERRPRITSDYTRCRHITHDYDSEIREEGIAALFAVPVVVQGVARAVLYGGTRGGSTPMNAFVEAGAAVAREFAQELRIEQEVARRLAERTERAIPNAPLEELRISYAELRRVAADVHDPELRERLMAIEHRLAGISSERGDRTAALTRGDPAGPLGATGTSGRAGALTSTAATAPLNVSLTPREIDALSQASLGLTNAGIGQALGLTESTVKSYLKTAMAKLEAPTRHAAVASARRLGILP